MVRIKRRWREGSRSRATHVKTSELGAVRIEDGVVVLHERRGDRVRIGSGSLRGSGHFLRRTHSSRRKRFKRKSWDSTAKQSAAPPPKTRKRHELQQERQTAARARPRSEAHTNGPARNRSCGVAAPRRHTPRSYHHSRAMSHFWVLTRPGKCSTRIFGNRRQPLAFV